MIYSFMQYVMHAFSQQGQHLYAQIIHLYIIFLYF